MISHINFTVWALFSRMTHQVVHKTSFGKGSLWVENCIKYEIPMPSVPDKHISKFNTQKKLVASRKIEINIYDHRSHRNPLASK